jgi:hypothetical protein
VLQHGVTQGPPVSVKPEIRKHRLYVDFNSLEELRRFVGHINFQNRRPVLRRAGLLDDMDGAMEKYILTREPMQRKTLIGGSS